MLQEGVDSHLQPGGSEIMVDDGFLGWSFTLIHFGTKILLKELALY